MGEIEGATIVNWLRFVTVTESPTGRANYLIVTGTPLSIGNANSPGDADQLVRVNHIHNHPSGLGTDLHHPLLHGLAAHTTGYTPWRLIYINGSGDEAEVALGANGTFFESNGASAAPGFRALVAGDIPTQLNAPLGVGVASSAVTGLNVLHTYAAGAARGQVVGLAQTLAGGDAADTVGVLGSVTLTDAGFNKTGFLAAFLGALTVAGTGTHTLLVGVRASGLTIISTATVTEYRAFEVVDVTPGASGTVTTQVGLYIPDLTSAGTNLGIQSVGAAVEHRIVGGLKLGADSAPAEKLDVAGNIKVSGNVDGVDVSALDTAVVKKADFNATTFLYATNDDTPQVKTPAEVMGILGFTATAAEVEEASIEIIIDGSGSPITTGIKGDIEIPFDCTTQQVTMLPDQSGTIVVDIWVDTYANFPPTDADSITASAPPTITATTKSQDSTLTGWTTALTKGHIMRFNVDSDPATSITRVTISLLVTKT